jgi:hypothetical protein
MNLNTYSNPVIIIGDKELEYYTQFTLNNPGNNQINSLTVTGINKSLIDYKLLNQEIVLYLNEGGTDSIPAFRGLIKKINPSEQTLSITALDPRILMSGKDAFPVIVDDIENYDGYTLVQFIHEYINANINTNSVKIGLDMLNETSPKLLMREFRTGLAVPYQIMQDCLSQIIDDADLENPIDYEFVMIDDGNKANISLLKRENLKNATPSISYDLLDGIQKISYQKITPPTFALVRGELDVKSRFQLGNMGSGQAGITVTGPYTDRDSAKRAGIIEVFKKQQQLNNINIQVTKGYNVGVGSIINLYINDNINETYDISDNHRVTAKTISYTQAKGCTMNLRLNNQNLKVSDFISG